MLNIYELNKILNLFNLNLAKQNGRYYLCNYNSSRIHIFPEGTETFSHSFEFSGIPYKIIFNDSSFIIKCDQEQITINSRGFFYSEKDKEGNNISKVDVTNEKLFFMTNSKDYISIIQAHTFHNLFNYLYAQEEYKGNDILKRELKIFRTDRTYMALLNNQIFTKEGMSASFSQVYDEVLNPDGTIQDKLQEYPAPKELLEKINSLVPGMLIYILDINQNFARVIPNDPKKEK